MCRPSLGASIAAATLVGVMGFGLWQMLGALRSMKPPAVPFNWIDFSHGRVTQGVEKQLDHSLPAREGLIAVANSLRYVLTRGGGEQVRVGRNDWLFLTDELRYEGSGQKPLQQRAILLGAASQHLARQGVILVVALVPDKARVYAEHLPGRTYPAYHESRFSDALKALREQGVAVADLLEPLMAAANRSQVYYRTDTHWNHNGAEVAAQAVAKAVRASGASWEKVTFTTAADGLPVARAGDLIKLMGLATMPDALRPRPDVETPVVTRQTSPVTTGGGGLFGETAVPVVLTGTSYSMRGNFHGYLQQALSANVLNTAKDGGGFLQAAADYLGNDAFRTSKPKVLVWEVPERFLLTKLDREAGWLKEVGLSR